MIGEDNGDGKRILLLVLWAAVMLSLLVMLAGCKTVYVPKPEYHTVHDTIIKKEVVEKEVIKEVTVRDSVSFQVKGDTIYLYRYRYERDHTYEKALQKKIDSLTYLKRDSIPYPVEVVREVEKPLKKWQKVMIWWGVICTLALISLIYIKMRFPKAR